MVSIWCLIHFICIKPANFAKNEMQNFGKNMSDFQKSTKKAYNSVYFRKNDFRRKKGISNFFVKSISCPKKSPKNISCPKNLAQKISCPK